MDRYCRKINSSTNTKEQGAGSGKLRNPHWSSTHTNSLTTKPHTAYPPIRPQPRPAPITTGTDRDRHRMRRALSRREKPCHCRQRRQKNRSGHHVTRRPNAEQRCAAPEKRRGSRSSPHHLQITVTVKVQWGSKGTREVLHEETIEAESIEAARQREGETGMSHRQEINGNIERARKHLQSALELLAGNPDLDDLNGAMHDIDRAKNETEGASDLLFDEQEIETN